MDNLLILVVDDDEGNRNMVCRVLRRRGYAVLTADGGREAILKLKEPIDLILLDQMMPKISGLELFMEMKKTEGFNIPVIMMTAYGNLPLAVSFMKEGGADFIEKPFDIDILILQIQKALERAAFQQRLRETETSKKAAIQVIRSKEDVLKDLSHELRPPINHILDSVGILRERVPKDLCTYVKDIEKSAHSLFTLLPMNSVNHGGDGRVGNGDQNKGD